MPTEQVVVNGMPVSGRSAERPRKGHAGTTFYDEELAELLSWEPQMRGLMSSVGKLINDTRTDKKLVSDHFHSPVINPAWILAKGNNGQAVNFAFDPTVLAGGVKAITGDSGTGIAADGVAISIDNPVQRSTTKAVDLAFSFKINAITNCQYFLGLTDVLPSTTLEEPFSLSGSSYVSTASDAAGLLFDTSAASDTLRLVSVANDVDGTAIDTGVAFEPNVFYDVHLVLNPDGSVIFRVFLEDGTPFSLGRDFQLPAGSVRTGQNLYPIVQANTRTTASRDVWLDFFRMHQYAAAA